MSFIIQNIFLKPSIEMALSGIDFGLFPKIETTLKGYMNSTINEFLKEGFKGSNQSDFINSWNDHSVR